MFRAALEAHKEAGLKMDFAMGPNQGQGVPAQPNDEGLVWDLAPFTIAIPQNGSYNDVIPGWGAGELVALVSAKVVSHTTLVNPTTGSNKTYDQYILEEGSLEDNSSLVNDSNGYVSVQFPVSLGATNRTGYRLFAFYQSLSGQKNLIFDNTENRTILDDGSYSVHHYSGKGAEVITRFWETYILDDATRELLTEVGNYGWDDSVEIRSNISWSRSLPDRFERLMGYGIKPILPLLTFKQNNVNIQIGDPGQFQCLLDIPDQGARYVNSFHTVLQDGYGEYLRTLVNWTANELGLKFSAQPSYNLPMDMMATIPLVDAPECESLGFSNNLDLYRQFTGPAQLAGRNIISNELGAEARGAFNYAVPRLLVSANIGFAGGVNQYVIHGQSYSGSYYETTWPGYVPWQYLVSESWNQKQPVWDHGFADAIAYMGRTQQVLQEGVPKIDVAGFWKQTVSNFSTAYDMTEIVDAGWTYSYISPDNFDIPEATVVDGVLALSGPAWKALLVYSSQNLSVAVVDALSKYAAAGLPLLFVNGSPSFYPLGDGSIEQEFQPKLNALMAQSDVYSVVSGEIDSALKRIGIYPQVTKVTEIAVNGTLQTVWRELATNKTGSLFLYSDGAAWKGKITVQLLETPYWFNSWTGERTPMATYQQSGNSTTIAINLAVSQTAIIVFSDELLSKINTPSIHITSNPFEAVDIAYDKTSSGFVAKVKASQESREILVSTNKSVSVSGKDVPEAFVLGNWKLTAEHWDAPANLSEQTVIAEKTNTTHQLPKLESWLDIPELVNTSGVGYYTTTFSWPPTEDLNTTELGAFFTIPNLLNSVRLYVNGAKAPPLDLFNAVVDISEYLLTGDNEVMIEAPTVMWNQVRTIIDEVVNAGQAPLVFFVMGSADVGLVSDVFVTPFKIMQISS